MDGQKRYIHGIFIILLFFAFVLLAAILKLTASVTIPLAISVLVSLVFEPVLYKLKNRLHIPWGAGIAVVFVIVFFILAFVTSLIATSCKTILTVYPKYEEKFLLLYSQIAKWFYLPFDEETSLFENLWNQLDVREFIQNFALSFSTKLIAYTKDFIMIFLFALFFLLELRYIRQKIDFAAELVPSSTTDNDPSTAERKKNRISTIIKDIIEQITSYISVKFFISLLTGALVFFTALVLKLDFAIIWAFLAFVLNFIPNFGSILSVLGTSVFALVQFWPHPLQAILTAIIMTLINFLIGNVAEPRIQGKNLGLSPFVIIASLSLWGWLWGFAGLVLGVPMTVIVKIVCENFSILRPVAAILGDWPPSSKNRN